MAAEWFACPARAEHGGRPTRTARRSRADRRASAVEQQRARAPSARRPCANARASCCSSAGVVEHTGAVDDAAQRRSAAPQSRQQRRSAGASATSSASATTSLPLRAQLVEQRRGLGRHAAPADQHERARRPARRASAPARSEARQAAGDEVACRRAGLRPVPRAPWRTTILPTWRACAMKRKARAASSSAKTWRGSGAARPARPRRPAARACRRSAPDSCSAVSPQSTTK